MRENATEPTRHEINEAIARMCGWEVLMKWPDGAISVHAATNGRFNPCESLDDCKLVEEKLGVRSRVSWYYKHNIGQCVCDVDVYTANMGRKIADGEADSEPLARATALAEVER